VIRLEASLARKIDGPRYFGAGAAANGALMMLLGTDASGARDRDTGPTW